MHRTVLRMFYSLHSKVCFQSTWLFLTIPFWVLLDIGIVFRAPEGWLYLVSASHIVVNFKECKKSAKLTCDTAAPNCMWSDMQDRETTKQSLGWLLALLTWKAPWISVSLAVLKPCLGEEQPLGVSAQLSLHCCLFMLETVLWCKMVSGCAGATGGSHTCKPTWHASIFLYYTSCQVRQSVQLIFLLAVYFPLNMELIKTFWTTLEPDSENQHYFYCSHFVLERNWWRQLFLMSFLPLVPLKEAIKWPWKINVRRLQDVAFVLTATVDGKQQTIVLRAIPPKRQADETLVLNVKTGSQKLLRMVALWGFVK